MEQLHPKVEAVACRYLWKKTGGRFLLVPLENIPKVCAICGSLLGKQTTLRLGRVDINVSQLS